MTQEYSTQKMQNNNSLSIKGHVWQLQTVDRSEDYILSAARTLKQPTTVIKLLYQLGLTDVETIDEFLKINISQAAAQILHIPHIDQGLARLKQAILHREKVKIISDYDVDGISAAALLIRYLRLWQCDVCTHIPHRFQEGYGPNESLVEQINQQDVDLILVLDSGSNAQCLNDVKCDVIVVDHHIVHTLLRKFILINGQLAPKSPQSKLLHCSDLCTAGLLFFFLCHLQKDQQLCNQPQAKFVNQMMSELKILVALATICDAVPLTAVNRAIVRSALTDLYSGQQIMLSMRVLLEFLGKNITQCSVQDLAFNVGPIINAASRVTGKADLALQLFTEDDLAKIQELIQALWDLNQERKRIEMIVWQEAKDQIRQKYTTALPACLVLYQSNWHLGVLGIVAGRIAQEFNRPVLILAENTSQSKDPKKTESTPHWQGSGRSITGVNLHVCLEKLKQHCSTLTGGGHKMAVGLSLSANDLQPLISHINDIMTDHSTGGLGPCVTYFNEEFENISGLDVAFVKKIDILSPFGVANPMPVFLLSNIKVIKKIEFNRVSRFYLCDMYDYTFSAIVFHHKGANLARYLVNSRMYDMLVHLSINHYKNTEQLQIIIEDVRPHGCSTDSIH